jgi:hypothetical protein
LMVSCASCCARATEFKNSVALNRTVVAILKLAMISFFQSSILNRIIVLKT